MTGTSSFASSQLSFSHLEELVLCLDKFCSVFSTMEEDLSEGQAAAFSLLSHQDRHVLQRAPFFIYTWLLAFNWLVNIITLVRVGVRG